MQKEWKLVNELPVSLYRFSVFGEDAAQKKRHENLTLQRQRLNATKDNLY